MHINHLAILAGPTCSGKSTLLNNIRNDKLNHIRESLGSVDVCTWQHEVTNKLDRLTPGSTDNILLDYAFPLLKLAGDASHGFDAEDNLSILDAAEKITVITLLIDTRQLLRHIKKRQHKLTLNVLKLSGPAACLKQKKRLKKLEAILSQDNDILISAYRRWFDFCESLNLDRHIIIANGEAPYTLPLNEWEKTITGSDIP